MPAINHVEIHDIDCPKLPAIDYVSVSMSVPVSVSVSVLVSMLMSVPALDLQE